MGYVFDESLVSCEAQGHAGHWPTSDHRVYDIDVFEVDEGHDS